ncbi:hypothetical protein F2Q69_00042678 [Brassica cretica]|uniref:Uncharacterized protein n=1 Tax=Brassica cretica TaxID=69181 RepID=A0A8S9NW96_BRACR|nr:hypothetical protein F2Q69_00042678 [Brassica cretica]
MISPQEKENPKEVGASTYKAWNLIQGPTPYGYKWHESLAQGGGSSMAGRSGENEFKVSREESGVELKDRINRVELVCLKPRDGRLSCSGESYPEEFLELLPTSETCLQHFVAIGENESKVRREESGAELKDTESGVAARLHTSQRSLKGETTPGNYAGLWSILQDRIDRVELIFLEPGDGRLSCSVESYLVEFLKLLPTSETCFQHYVAIGKSAKLPRALK